MCHLGTTCANPSLLCSNDAELALALSSALNSRGSCLRTRTFTENVECHETKVTLRVREQQTAPNFLLGLAPLIGGQRGCRCKAAQNHLPPFGLGGLDIELLLLERHAYFICRETEWVRNRRQFFENADSMAEPANCMRRVVRRLMRGMATPSLTCAVSLGFFRIDLRGPVRILGVVVCVVLVPSRVDWRLRPLKETCILVEAPSGVALFLLASCTVAKKAARDMGALEATVGIEV